MRNKSFLASLGLFAMLAVAVPAFAKPMSAVLPLSHGAKVGQSELQAGEYRFLIDGDHLSIYKGKSQVAEARGRWEDRDAKAEYNSTVSTTDGRLIEIRFEGKKSVFVLAQ